MTKKKLLEELAEYPDDSEIVIEIRHDPDIIPEDLYDIRIDPIHMGLDSNGKDCGFEIRLEPDKGN